MGANNQARRRLTGWAVIVAAVTIVLAVGGPLLGRGVFIAVDAIRTFPPWNADTPTDFEYRHGPANDTVNSGTPARVAIREGLVDDLRIPLWDPYPNGGTPLGSQPSAGLLSPLNWPEIVLGVKLGAAWAALLRFAVAAIGAYALLRRLGVSRFAGVCGGLIYSTSGFMILWTNFPQSDIAALLPALFLTADILRERRRPRDVAWFAVVVAAMLLEGYPPLLLASMYALAAFLVVRWWESSTPGTSDAGSTSDRARRVGARLREAVTPSALVVGALTLGAAIAAFQVLPFALRLGAYDTTYRTLDQPVGSEASALLAMAFPWALGKAEVVGNQPLTFLLEGGRAFFVGAAAVVLALWAVVRGRPEPVTRGTYRYFLVGAVVLLLALVQGRYEASTNVNDLVTDVLYALPGMSQVPLSRLVALFVFFVALLAAFGIEHLVSTSAIPRRTGRRWLIRFAVIGAFLGYFGYSAIRSERRILWLVGGQSWVVRNSIVPGLLAIAAVVVIVVAWRWHDPRRWIAIAAIPVLLAVEALLVTTPLLPRAPRADFYPQTPALRYLARHLDGERFAAAGDMLFQSANSYYGLRSVSGHSFVPPAWRDLVTSTSPGAFDFETHTVLSGNLDTATSPVLDQLSARYFVASAEQPPFGRPEPAPAATSTAVLERRAPATGTVGPGPLRAVGLTIVDPEPLRGTLVFLDATVRDGRGTVVARGTRRLTSMPETTQVFVPIAGEDLPDRAEPWRVEIALRSNAADRMNVATTAAGHVALSAIRPAADGLELTHADQGAVIYRRRSALPRIRWASRTTVIPRAAPRIARLADGTLDPDTVVLDRPGPRAGGEPAEVLVREDSGDQIRATVRARGDGYLVVADSIQQDWSARVDGRPVELRDANHAVVAIPVPAGTHTVTLAAAPRGWRAGIAVTIAATLLVVLLLAGPALFRRTRARRAGPQPEPERGA